MDVSRKRWSTIADLINDKAGKTIIRIDTQTDTVYKFDESANAFLYECNLEQTSKQELYDEFV
jgi:hypothetical protein